MNFTLSKTLRIGASAVCLSAVVMMGVCGQKDKGGAPIISAEKAPLGLSSLSDKDLARHFSVPKRITDDVEAKKALAALGLTESNSNGLSWDSQKGSGGNYIFTNMKSASSDGMITIAKAEIFGVHMNGEDATFDRADFGNVSLTGEDVKLNVDSMSLSRPTAATAKALINSLEDLTKDTDLDFGDNADFGFGALSMKSVNITAAELTGTIDQLVWGKDDTTGRADVKVGNVDLTLPLEGSDVASLMTLKSFSARGINTDDISKGFTAGANGNASSLSSMLAGFNVYKKPYDSVKLEGFKYDSAAVNVDMPKIEAETNVKGDITTVTQLLSPMTIQVNDGAKGSAGQAYDMLQQLGFDKMTFKSSQTTVLDKGKDTMEVKDGIFDMAEGFRLNYTYGTSGLKALADTQRDQTAQLNNVLENMKINGMTLSLEDKSIVERGLKLAGQLRGASPDRVKQEMRAALAFAPLAARNSLEKEIIGELGGAFMDFIDDGGTLTIQLDPAAPIAFSALENPEKVSPKDLGFSARQDN